MKLFHVTFTKHLGSIFRYGLRLCQCPNWSGQGKPDRPYQEEPYIFACQHFDDAVRWAAHMDWTFHKQTGSGKICVIEFEGHPAVWQDDPSDPISQMGNRARWMRSHSHVPHEVLGNVTLIRLEEVKAWKLRQDEFYKTLN